MKGYSGRKTKRKARTERNRKKQSMKGGMKLKPLQANLMISQKGTK